jgi:hypothetical protein
MGAEIKASDIALNEDLNILDDRAAYLLKQYVTIPFNQWILGSLTGVRLGNIYKLIVESDELCANEKAYCIAIIAEQASRHILKYALLNDMNTFRNLMQLNCDIEVKPK